MMWKIDKYPITTESGIEWIGEIPTHWGKTKVGNIYDITLGKMVQPKRNSGTDVLVPYLKAMNVQDGYINNNDVDKMFATESEIQKLSIERGDILVCEGGEVARSTVVHEDYQGFVFQNSLHRVREQGKGDNVFLHYLLIAIRHSGFINILVNKATIAHFTKEKFSSLKICVPPIEEQRTITSFLNLKTSEIESLIADKEKLIELLLEKRQAIINEAVTKGLNPDVKMKDSYIGEIPEEWICLPLKRIVLTKITDGPHETPNLVNEGIPFLSAEAVKGGKVNFNLKRGYISIEDHKKFSKKCKPQFGDLFLIKSGATTGEVGYVDTDMEFNIWSPLALIRCDIKKALPRYIFYYTSSKVFKTQVETKWNYGTQQNIGMGVIENLYVTLPPKVEQEKIVEFLENKVSEIENVMNFVSIQIKKLKEYRQSLIYEAVTGKIDVREYKKVLS